MRIEIKIGREDASVEELLQLIRDNIDRCAKIEPGERLTLKKCYHDETLKLVGTGPALGTIEVFYE